MNRLVLLTVLSAALLLTAACSYDETLDTCDVTVQLVYPDDSVEPYAGVRVELRDRQASVFVDSTDAGGTVHFRVPPGIYEATSATQLVTYDWRYNFNGVLSRIVVSPDSLNRHRLELTMSRRRIVH